MPDRYQFAFWVLVGSTAFVGMLFFRVVQPFILAIFIALVLTVLFAPLHQWLTDRIAGHDRIAAGLTAVLVTVAVLLPICVTLIMAGTQVMRTGAEIADRFEVSSGAEPEAAIDLVQETRVGSVIDELRSRLPKEQRDQVRRAFSRIVDGVTAELYTKTRGLLSDVFAFGVSFGVMMLSLYYFLADRDVFLRELHRMLPLENREEERLTDRFQSVCRGVVAGTIVAGLAQATLAGIAFAVLGVPNAWLLIVLTMFSSFIPFFGSAIVWVSVASWLLLDGRYGAGIGLLIYGAAIISTADNLVRAYVIGNQAKLHPLIALVTVLGALKLMGLWGIFVGPMIAAFFYALLNIARDRVASHGQVAS
ncbi:putative inner membrane protein [Stieleria maiorica]|uniref:Putative inner membrane protein n=1 Tax=Stieleria maiorica TaxID=2795974 RepID=A0A5B9MBK2_9BACT|nr:AI-2E family transporter [Stieleria maiorica]QEF97616.1 putative inner membrane protein [Stieleria maiorica]